MQRFQDIQISDNLLKSQFFNYFLNGDYQMAFDLISHNSQLDSKAFVANFINEIAEVLYATEDSVDTATLGKLRELSLDFNEIINQFLNRYDYDSTATYELYNFVIYNNEVYMYINNIPSTGNIPTNTTYWLKIGLRGEKGAGGCSQLQMKFYWQEGIAYQPFDLVITIPQGTTHTGDMWVAKVANINQYPTEDSVYWEKFVEASNGFIYSSKTQPVDRYIGQIWLDMSFYIYQTDSEVAYSKIVPNNAVSANVLSIGGKSVVFNQLINIADFRSAEINGITYTVDTENGTVTANGTATADSFNNVSIKIEKNHKYYIRGCPKGGSENTYYFGSSLGLSSMDVGDGIILNNINITDIYPYPMIKNGTTVNNIVFRPQYTDLTRAFGAGNEPTLEECRRIFASDYYPYNEGEIVSADVDEVEVKGRNLVRSINRVTNQYYFNGTTQSTQFQFEAGTYAISYERKENASVYYKTASVDTNVRITQDASAVFTINEPFNAWIYRSGMQDGDVYNVQLTKSDSVLPYSPYRDPIDIPIPTAIRNLPGYGWSAGSAYNEVDFVNKQYIQRVEYGKLINIASSFSPSSLYKGSIYSSKGSLKNIKPDTLNIISADIEFTGLYDASTYAFGQMNVQTNGTINAWVKDGAFSGQSEINSIASNTMLCYELKTPIVTDISDLLTFNFKNIKVEEGGTITFHQSNESYHLEIPNSIKYKIKEE